MDKTCAGICVLEETQPTWILFFRTATSTPKILHLLVLSDETEKVYIKKGLFL